MKEYVNLEYHPSDSRIRVVAEDISQTLNSRMGTGGGNVPLVLEVRNDRYPETVQRCDSPGNGDIPNA